MPSSNRVIHRQPCKHGCAQPVVMYKSFEALRAITMADQGVVVERNAGSHRYAEPVWPAEANGFADDGEHHKQRKIAKHHGGNVVPAE